ncbi:MAG TPA: ferritin-like domain-containing protein [Ktedonobacteraceae bacterium]|jgi:hypothetical protein
MVASETPEMTFTANDWLCYFQKNRYQRLTIPWERGIVAEPSLRRPLIHSLQRFQVGEQGDGLHLRKGAARIADPDYIDAIDLFIKEEQEHSRLLAKIIESMGGSLLAYHWSDICFIFLRRLLRLRLELLVLLVAEIIAQAYYKILYDGTPDIVLRSVFGQILHDEQGHVAFHRAYLRQSFAKISPLQRQLLYRSWQLFYMFVCLVVIYDHRAVFRAIGVTPPMVWVHCMQTFHDAHIFH